MKPKLLRVSSPRKAALLAVLCFCIYALTYLGRINYSAALVDMIATGTISKTQGGMIATVYFFCYGAGQLINGALADRFQPVWQVTLGVLGSGILNVLMSIVSPYPGMVFIWGLNGYFQSLVWAPVLLIVARSVPDKQRSRALLLLNTAPAAGTMLAYAFSSLVLWKLSWQCVFSYAGVAMVLTLPLWVIGCRYAYRGASVCEVAVPAPNPAACSKGLPFRMLAIIGGLWLILPAMVHGMLKDGITSWLPTYMTEMFSMPTQSAVTLTMILPLINLVGATAAYWLMSRIPDEVKCSSIFFGVAFASLLALKIAGLLNPVLTIVLFALATASMMAVNVMLVSEVPVRFASYGKTATISGFFNASGYIGTAISMYGIAYFSQTMGWGVTQWIWIGSCVGAIACCFLALGGWTRFKKS